MKMPHRLHSLMFALLFAALPLSVTSAPATSGAETVDQAWTKAVMAGDLNAVMALYAKDAIMWLPGAPEAKGTEAIRKSYTEFFAANTVTRASFANAHYQSGGNFSVGWGDFTLVLKPKKGGDSVTLSGRFSVIATKENGKWVYLVDHASMPAPPAKPGA
jgi:uncharacterized protein (TIGR02246 family)